jgi:hypothetical protein
MMNFKQTNQNQGDVYNVPHLYTRPLCWAGFLDMDGTLVDFRAGALKAHGWTLPDDDGEYEFWKKFEVTASDFWGPLRNEEFWANLQPTPEAFNLVLLAEKYFGVDNVFLCSSGACPRSGIGKLMWIEKYLPHYRGRVQLLGPDKYKMARPGYVLIDDYDLYIEQWRMAGGHAITFPRPWNTMHAASVSQLRVVEQGLKLYMGG